MLINKIYWIHLLIFIFIKFEGFSQTKVEVGEQSEIVNIGKSKQLFIDDALIDFSNDVDFEMHSPYSGGEELLIADLPFEKGGYVYLYSSVLKDKESDKVKIWYDFFRPKSEDNPYDHDRHIGYAESNDGIYFVKPSLGLHSIDGSKKNNVVIPGMIGGSSVWQDPKASPENRYKTQAKVYPSGKFYMHSSPDGIHWNLYSDIDPRGPHDTQTIIFWDESLQEYLFYGRYFLENNGIRQRGVRRAIMSNNFSDIKNTGLAILPDIQDKSKYSDVQERGNTVDYYGATVFIYEDVYIMLAQSFWHWNPNTEYQGTEEPGMRDIRLAVSRNSIDFKRVGERRPFMSPGPLGRFDSKQIWAMPNPIIMGDEIWIYYCGVNWDRAGRVDPYAEGGKKEAAISRAILRLDGFVSLNASYNGKGEVVTKPIIFSGNSLELNADTGAGGSIRVEILDNDGNIISGFTKEECDWVVGNSVRHLVNWNSKEDLEDLNGQPIRLRFLMRDCELYSFQFK
ncbi:hypothetical protein [Membranihabitans maritimus]|uniref:hypothetical protein n=1 Tax=Membranihabitans maritimus TaxID=2904244 RepID=UPI001F29DE31|nr:hypothetical protein [Membranihabitans maritimus]